ncbi:type II toxin-antitoxin system RelE/ParE family toxin [Pseudidiomarina aestuarii]|uniref:type II toxin-antitoxin system RelE/ParE family toxin n=1 Tax=Pseudidiomarina aestuarii TaxID=624146 RepID=UPI003A984FB0
MAIKFRDMWLELFYEASEGNKRIPKQIESTLYRKLQILDAATQESDLIIPPGNRFEHLAGKLHGWCSIRVNRQYRLIFQWQDKTAMQTYLDPHRY